MAASFQPPTAARTLSMDQAPGLPQGFYEGSPLRFDFPSMSGAGSLLQQATAMHTNVATAAAAGSSIHSVLGHQWVHSRGLAPDQIGTCGHQCLSHTVLCMQAREVQQQDMCRATLPLQASWFWI